MFMFKFLVVMLTMSAVAAYVNQSPDNLLSCLALIAQKLKDFEIGEKLTQLNSESFLRYENSRVTEGRNYLENEGQIQVNECRPKCQELISLVQGLNQDCRAHYGNAQHMPGHILTLVVDAHPDLGDRVQAYYLCCSLFRDLMTNSTS